MCPEILLYIEDLPAVEPNGKEITLHPGGRVILETTVPAAMLQHLDTLTTDHELIFHLRSRTAQQGIEIIKIIPDDKTQEKYQLLVENRGTCIVTMPPDIEDLYELAIIQKPAITGEMLQSITSGTPAEVATDTDGIQHIRLPLPWQIVQSYRNGATHPMSDLPRGRQRDELYKYLGYNTVPIESNQPDHLADSNLILLGTDPFAVPDGYVYLLDEVVIEYGVDNQVYELRIPHHRSQILRSDTPIIQVTECQRFGSDPSTITRAYAVAHLYKLTFVS